MTKEKVIIVLVIFLFWMLASFLSFAIIHLSSGNVRTMETVVLAKRKQGKKYWIEIRTNGERKELRADKKGYEETEKGTQILLIRKQKVVGVRNSPLNKKGKGEK